MNPRINPVDCVVRVVTSLLVLGVGYYNHSGWGLLGLPLLLTAAVRYCPAHDRSRSDDLNRFDRKP